MIVDRRAGRPRGSGAHPPDLRARRGARAVGTARGGVVDQAALRAALAEGRLAGAALDVFEVEPCPADEPILKMDNVIVTPHAICWTDECFAGNGAADVAAVRAVLEGRAPAVLVDRGVTAHPAWRARLAANAARFGAASRA